jgi:hypothetical protein
MRTEAARMGFSWTDMNNVVYYEHLQSLQVFGVFMIENHRTAPCICTGHLLRIIVQVTIGFPRWRTHRNSKHEFIKQMARLIERTLGHRQYPDSIFVTVTFSHTTTISSLRVGASSATTLQPSCNQNAVIRQPLISQCHESYS